MLTVMNNWKAVRAWGRRVSRGRRQYSQLSILKNLVVYYCKRNVKIENKVSFDRLNLQGP